MKSLSLMMLLCVLLLGSACAKKQNTPLEQNNSQASSVLDEGLATDNAAREGINSQGITVTDDYDDFDAYGDFEDYDTKVQADPLIIWNKAWFTFNDFVLLKVAKPVHKAYVKVTPQKIRSGLGYFKYNLNAPVRMANALLQAEFKQFFVEFGKFIINTTTSAGFADVASRNKVLVPYKAQQLCLGYTLAKWNLPEGPYLILPFYGPSTIRESVGTLGDLTAEPLAYLFPWEVALAAGSLFTVNDFGTLYTSYETFKESSFDPYISLRNAYLEKLSYNRPE